jgi:hypothetical protein
MKIYDDYSMFLNIYNNYISNKYEICFLNDPYIYLYNFTSNSSISHFINSNKHIENKTHDLNLYKTYDISNLDVTKIKSFLNNHYLFNQKMYIENFEEWINIYYMIYNKTSLNNIIDNNSLKNN